MAFIGLCRPKSANSSNPAFKPVSRPPRVVESKNEYQEPFYDSGDTKKYIYLYLIKSVISISEYPCK